MKLLVTGANGFVGSALCRHAEEAGHTVVRAVRRPTGAAGERVVGDLGPATDWREALAGIDAVIHLAARVHMLHDPSADPLAAYREVNTAGTLKLAADAEAAGVKRFVFVSSIKVNGEGTAPGRPYTPADSPAPADPYGVSKAEAEAGLMTLDGAMSVTVVRPPLVYGPGVGANFLRLMKLADTGWPLPLGAIDNRRSLVYVGNLVDLLLACALRPEAAGKTYLPHDGTPLSTPSLIRLMAEALGKPARLAPVPVALLRLAAGVAGRSAEIDRLAGSLVVADDGPQRDFGWRPPFTVEDGIAATVRWYKEGRRG